MFSWAGKEVLNKANVRYEDDWERVSFESSRNGEETTRGTNYSIHHQSIAGRFSDDNVKENSLKHKNNTQQKTKLIKSWT